MIIVQKYLLKEFGYDKENNRWSIISAEWLGDDRIECVLA
jgi:hypothetical protein